MRGPDHEDGELHPGREPELHEQVLEMALDGVSTDPEAAGDLGIRCADCDQLGDCPFCAGYRSCWSPIAVGKNDELTMAVLVKVRPLMRFEHRSAPRTGLDS